MSVLPFDLSLVPLDAALLAGRALFLVFSFVIAAVSFTRWRRSAQRDAARSDKQLQLVLEQLQRMETLLGQSEARVAALSERWEARYERAGAAANYQVAIRLARAGAACDDLITSCGLNRQEAELVTRLHGPDNRSGRRHPAAA
ncbi:MAG TPA: DUF2802 domain-containing protein [Steroidobacteraceae bacterium]|nr:DUF2802 domain-containing protein [Steroidobacteraceae bacterium]